MKIKLNNQEHGYRDYDVTTLNSTIHRACVPFNIQNGDVFNIYFGHSSKAGCVWRDNLETSLTDFIRSEPTCTTLKVVALSYEERKMVDMEIPLTNIVGFSLVNHRAWRKDGGFKAFRKVVFIKVKMDDTLKNIRCSHYNLKFLKEFFNGRTTVEKFVETEFKSYKTRFNSKLCKAIDYYYSVK